MLPAVRVRGTCHVYQAVDLGFAVDLSRAEQIFAGDQLSQHFKKPRRAPEAQQLQRHSFRIAQGGFPVQIGAFRSEGPVEIVLWEFGAATIAYQIPIDCDYDELVGLCDSLWAHGEPHGAANGITAQVTSAGMNASAGARMNNGRFAAAG